MSDNEYRYTGTSTLRDDTKSILDGARYLKHRYIVSRHGHPVAQIIPPSDEQGIDIDLQKMILTLGLSDSA